MEAGLDSDDPGSEGSTKGVFIMLVLAISEIQLFVPGAKHAVGHLVFPAPPRRSLYYPFSKDIFDY